MNKLKLVMAVIRVGSSFQSDMPPAIKLCLSQTLVNFFSYYRDAMLVNLTTCTIK